MLLITLFLVVGCIKSIPKDAAEEIVAVEMSSKKPQRQSTSSSQPTHNPIVRQSRDGDTRKEMKTKRKEVM